jgi:ADP-heptose:LPS heptosyltransferase/GT2 family glycosyltransferase
VNNVTVSIVTYSEVRRAKACVESVLKTAPTAKLILTANGNTKAAEYFRTIPSALVIEHPENLGFGRAHNAAFAKCETEFFLCLNDDAVVHTRWLERLMEPFLVHQNAAISCPENTCSELLTNFHGKAGNKEYCEGSCLLVKSEVARKHGLFDATLPGLAYGEDSDLSLRYRQLGYTIHWTKAQISHERCQTSNKMGDIVRQWQNMNHAVLQRRWAHYLRYRTFGNPIVIVRQAAHGDVLLTTPVIESLRKQRPLSKIYVETAVPEIFKYNPDVTEAKQRIPRMPSEQRINLDGSYEAQPDKNFLDTYANAAAIKLETRKTKIFSSPEDKKLAAFRLGNKPWVAIHAGPNTWKNKEWPQDRFAAVAMLIRSRGFSVILVGNSSDSKIPCDCDMRGRTTIQEMAALLERCVLFVGIDSFPIHCAQAVGTPVVGLFGVTRPEPILTEGSSWWAARSDDSHPASGLRHKIRNSVNTRSDSNPMETISVEQVCKIVQEALTQCKKNAESPATSFPETASPLTTAST